MQVGLIQFWPRIKIPWDVKKAENISSQESEVPDHKYATYTRYVYNSCLSL